jgi:hypothetical protein
MDASVPRLAARLIFHRDGLDQLIVITADGDIVDDRPIPERVTGPDAWDRQLFTAGYRRLSKWQPTRSGYRCHVAALTE